jgi:membrane protein required for colicin V production
MTGFDIIVLLVVGAGASLGFLRGFVQESVSLLSWAVALLAIRWLHEPLAAYLQPSVKTQSGAWVLAFLLLALVPYFGVRLLARYLGKTSRNSALAPVDRVLGFGFGAVKGTILVVLGFSVLVLGYDTIWGAGGRPAWLVKSRTYSFVDASSEALVKMIGDRRKAAADAAKAGGDAKPDVHPTAHARRRKAHAAE